MRTIGLRATATLAGLCAALLAREGHAQTAAARRDDGPSRWADSQVSMGFSANGSFFDRSYGLSGDSTATADFGLGLQPRFRVHRMFQLRALWDLGVTLNNSDSTTTQHELRPSDPVLLFWFDGIPPVGGLRLGLAGTLAFPVSARSRADTMILAPGLLAQAHWEVRAFGGTFRAIGRVGWVHPVHEYSTPGIMGTRMYRVAGGPTASAQLSGRTNVHDQLAWNLTLTQAWGAWSPGFQFGMFHQWAYDAVGPSSGLSGGESDARVYTDFAFWLDLSPNAWFTLEAGYAITRQLLDADGTYGNPFYSPYADWRVYVLVNFVVDRIVDNFIGHPRPERGIVRW